MQTNIPRVQINKLRVRALYAKTIGPVIWMYIQRARVIDLASGRNRTNSLDGGWLIVITLLDMGGETTQPTMDGNNGPCGIQ